MADKGHERYQQILNLYARRKDMSAAGMDTTRIDTARIECLEKRLEEEEEKGGGRRMLNTAKPFLLTPVLVKICSYYLT